MTATSNLGSYRLCQTDDVQPRRRLPPMCAPAQTVDGAALYAILSNRRL